MYPYRGGGRAGFFGSALFSASFALFYPPEVGKRRGKKSFMGEKIVSVFLKKLKKTYFIVSFFLGLRAVTGKGVI